MKRFAVTICGRPDEIVRADLAQIHDGHLLLSATNPSGFHDPVAIFGPGVWTAVREGREDAADEAPRNAVHYESPGPFKNDVRMVVDLPAEKWLRLAEMVADEPGFRPFSTFIKAHIKAEAAE